MRGGSGDASCFGFREFSGQPPGTRKKVSRNPYTRSTTTPPPNPNISGEKKKPLAPDDMTGLLSTGNVVGCWLRTGCWLSGEIYRHKGFRQCGAPLHRADTFLLS